jgi:hypothetical protein
MKKLRLGLIIFSAALILSGCGNKLPENSPGKVAQLGEQPKEESSAGVQVINSLREAMGLGKKMECVYTTEINGQTIQSVTQMEGKNFKSSSEIEGKKMYSLMKDEVMYTWGEGIPMPSKLELSCMKELEKDLPKTEGENSQAKGFQNPEDSFDKAQNVSCKPVVTVDLSLPSDVQFSDMCEMLKGMMKNLKDMKVPTEVKGPPNLPEAPGAN